MTIIGAGFLAISVVPVVWVLYEVAKRPADAPEDYAALDWLFAMFVAGVIAMVGLPMVIVGLKTVARAAKHDNPRPPSTPSALSGVGSQAWPPPPPPSR
jgi:hypothetical protein